MPYKKPLALVILDGFGYRKDPWYNAIAHARKPTFDYLLQTYPYTLLQASGQAVGLPPGTIGNSEVGHCTIGSGRIIPQPSLRIDTAIQDKSLFSNSVLLENFNTLKKNGGKLHCMGLLSDAGVHSKQTHLYAFLRLAKQCGLQKVYVHAFLDGRDVPHASASTYLYRRSLACLAQYMADFMQWTVIIIGNAHNKVTTY
jgi:2,3-bisphosphoglycerate-independent phosphoglycerate mutase